MDNRTWHVAVISPVLFLVPSILVTGMGRVKGVVMNPLFLVNLLLMSTPVAPLSTSAWVFAVIPFCWTRTSRRIDGEPVTRRTLVFFPFFLLSFSLTFTLTRTIRYAL